MAPSSSPRFIDATFVRAALPMSAAIAAMHEAFGALASSRAELPARTLVPIPQSDAALLVMPARIDSPPALGAKLVTVFPHNPEMGLPMIHAIVVLMDPLTGAPRTLIDGSSLTAIRTGAVSGLATDLVARSDASSVAILGAGVQARTQLEAMLTVRNIDRVTIWSRTRANADVFSREVQSWRNRPTDIRVAKTPKEAVHNVDIVCCATSSTTALITAQDIAPGTHINAVGSFTHEMHEFDATLIVASRVFVDQREAAMEEAGELIQAADEGMLDPRTLIELGSIVNGDAKGRESNDQITLFKSVGLAIQDLAAGAYIERALQQLG